MAYTVAVTFFIYGFEYWALHRIDETSFKGADDARFWDFVGYSFGTLTTTSLSHIEPANGLSILISYSEVGCSVLILVILVFSILTAAREAFRESAEEFITELREIAAVVEKRVFEVYELTLVQLELTLIRENAAFVNRLRRARGLTDLPSPTSLAPGISGPNAAESNASGDPKFSEQGPKPPLNTEV